jgi:hypothetical protein
LLHLDPEGDGTLVIERDHFRIIVYTKRRAGQGCWGVACGFPRGAGGGGKSAEKAWPVSGSVKD